VLVSPEVRQAPDGREAIHIEIDSRTDPISKGYHVALAGADCDPDSDFEE
jgi:hypothetical protein